MYESLKMFLFKNETTTCTAKLPPKLYMIVRISAKLGEMRQAGYT